MKEICNKEYGEGTMTDDEIMEMGIRLLRVYRLLLIHQYKKEHNTEIRLELTENESKALAFIREKLALHQQPSVRRSLRPSA